MERIQKDPRKVREVIETWRGREYRESSPLGSMAGIVQSHSSPSELW